MAMVWSNSHPRSIWIKLKIFNIRQVKTTLNSRHPIPSFCWSRRVWWVWCRKWQTIRILLGFSRSNSSHSSCCRVTVNSSRDKEATLAIWITLLRVRQCNWIIKMTIVEDSYHRLSSNRNKAPSTSLNASRVTGRNEPSRSWVSSIPHWHQKSFIKMERLAD